MSPTNLTERLRRVAAFFLRPGIGQPVRATILVRLAVGGVFLSSGLVKFLFENQGPGRFAKIGLPPQWALAVGAIEVGCGALLVLGLFTRLAALPLVADMVVAIVTTKLPLLFGAGPEPVTAMPKTGFWAFAYPGAPRRDDACRMRVPRRRGCRLWSLDAILSRRRWEGRLRVDPSVSGGRSPAR